MVPLSFYLYRKSLSVSSHTHIRDPTTYLILTFYILTGTVIKKGGAGRHQSELSSSQLTLMLKVIPSPSPLEFWHLSSVCWQSIMADDFFAITFFQLLTPALATHGLTVTCVKSSVLLLYRRISITSAFGRLTVVFGTLCIAWLFASTFGQVFLCSPMSAAWNPKPIFSSKCRDDQAFIIEFRSRTWYSMLLSCVCRCRS